MNEEIFNENDLGAVPWQYQIIHESTDCFKIGEIVFLKSNPEIMLTVVKLENERVFVSSEWDEWDISPECLLQYKYAGLMYNFHYKFIKISLN